MLTRLQLVLFAFAFVQRWEGHLDLDLVSEKYINMNNDPRTNILCNGSLTFFERLRADLHGTTL